MLIDYRPVEDDWRPDADDWLPVGVGHAAVTVVPATRRPRRFVHTGRRTDTFTLGGPRERLPTGIWPGDEVRFLASVVRTPSPDVQHVGRVPDGSEPVQCRVRLPVENGRDGGIRTDETSGRGRGQSQVRTVSGRCQAAGPPYRIYCLGQGSHCYPEFSAAGRDCDAHYSFSATMTDAIVTDGDDADSQGRHIESPRTDSVALRKPLLPRDLGRALPSSRWPGQPHLRGPRNRPTGRTAPSSTVRGSPRSRADPARAHETDRRLSSRYLSAPSEAVVCLTCPPSPDARCSRPSASVRPEPVATSRAFAPPTARPTGSPAASVRRHPHRIVPLFNSPSGYPLSYVWR